MAPQAIFIQVKLPTIIEPATNKATRPSYDLPWSLILGAKIAKWESFDLASKTEQLTPRSIYTMEQIGLEGHGMPLHAATDPFPLFPETAMVKIREQIFN